MLNADSEEWYSSQEASLLSYIYIEKGHRSTGTKYMVSQHAIAHEICR